MARTPEEQKEFDDLKRRFNVFEELFLKHRHAGVSNDQTRPAFPQVIAGTFASDGTYGAPLTPGWTTEKTATGVYDITHTLGHTNYLVVAIGQAKVYCQLSAKDETSFTLKTFNDGGTATDSAVDFVVIIYR